MKTSPSRPLPLVAALCAAALSTGLAAGCNTLRPGIDGAVHDLGPVHEGLPSASAWGAPAAHDAADREGVDELRAAFEGALSAEQRNHLRFDPALSTFARVTAFAGVSTRQPLADETEAWLRWRLGIAEPTVTTSYSWASGVSWREPVLQDVLAWAKKQKGAARARYGLAVLTSGKRHGVGFVVVRDSVALEPLPMQVAAGASLSLRGRLLEPVARPRVFVVDAAGAARAFDIAPGADGSFSLSIPLTAPGRALIELRGGLPGPDADELHSSLLLMPVGVGAPASFSEADERAAAGARPGTPVNRDVLLAQLARGRAAAGQPPLHRDADADAAMCARDAAARADDFRASAPPPAPLPARGLVTRWGTYRRGSDLQWSIATSPSVAHALATHTNLAVCVTPDGETQRVRYGLWGRAKGDDAKGDDAKGDDAKGDDAKGERTEDGTPVGPATPAGSAAAGVSAQP